MNRTIALARLELGNVLRSRWLIFSAGLYAVLAALFLFLGLRESSVLGFTGMDRVLLSLSHALLLLLPLLALTGVGLVVNHAREDGSLELLFSHPVTRSDYLNAVTLVHCTALLLPLLILLPGLALAGTLVFGQPVPWVLLLRSLAVSTALLWTFTGLGLAISVLVRELGKAMMLLLVVWVLAVGLLDFGLLGIMLQWQLPAPAVFALAALNPLEMARIALLSGFEQSLGTLGPVGYYLGQHFSPAGLLAIGLSWSVLVGAGTWTIARRRFRAGDLV